MRRSKPMPFPSHHSAFHLHPSLTPGQKALVQASREFGERSGLGGELALWLYGLWWEAVESSCLQVAALPGKAALGKGIYRLVHSHPASQLRVSYLSAVRTCQFSLAHCVTSLGPTPASCPPGRESVKAGKKQVLPSLRSKMSHFQ